MEDLPFFGAEVEKSKDGGNLPIRSSSSDINIDISNLVDKLLKKGKFFINNQELLEKIDENSDVIQELTGYPIKRILQDRSFRFRKDLKERINQSLNFLIRFGYLNEDGTLSEKALNIYSSRVSNWVDKNLKGVVSFGRRKSNILGKDESHYSKFYSIGDSYSEISARKSVRSYLKSKKLVVEKKVAEKGGKYLVLLDVSGSMYGEKIYEAKKALVALLYRILKNDDAYHIILFNDKIVGEFSHEDNLSSVLYRIFKVSPIGSTDIALALYTALKRAGEKSHIVLITDALPTFGRNPIEKSIEVAHRIRSLGSSLSIIGIKLSEEGLDNAKRLVKAGGGNLYVVKEVGEIPTVLLADYLIFRSSKKKNIQ